LSSEALLRCCFSVSAVERTVLSDVNWKQCVGQWTASAKTSLYRCT